ncbi:MAG: amidinotransferase [Burkholderiales bacterium]|nr:amidinotransferase [Burkholderiales bacterium]
MPSSTLQAPAAVVMVRPQHFHPNPETAADNAFQQPAGTRPAAALAAQAHAEVSAAAARLQAAGVRVHLFDSHDPGTPDAVFPNNWFSTHAGGQVALYPMYAPSRRRERRSDIVEMLKAHYRVQDVIDYSGLEHDGLYLEGTGAMVLDHIGRVAYAAQSQRADPRALERFCTRFHFEPMAFATADAQGRPCYHTNVMLCVGTDFALGGFGLIRDAQRRAAVRARLRESGRTLIELDAPQIAAFAGNALELTGRGGQRLLALSETACRSLGAAQKAAIERSATLLPLRVPTIELAGGSVRCMLAGIHLAPRTAPPAPDLEEKWAAAPVDQALTAM